MTPAFAALRRYALGFPETREDLPWGESAIKVRNKTFLFMRKGEDGLHLTVKLPQSAPFALDRPFVTRTGYGLGASGWVTADFSPKEKPPMDDLKAWIAESYRAVAPKQLLAAAKDEKPPTKRSRKINGRAATPH